VRETPRDKLTLYSTYIYGSDDSTPPSRTTANALRAGVRGDYNLTPKVFVFALADFETNELQHLDLRSTFGWSEKSSTPSSASAPRWRSDSPSIQIFLIPVSTAWNLIPQCRQP
jgi:hypothetical protein